MFDQTTVKSSHNSKYNFNNEDDFAIAFRINPNSASADNNFKKYIISKSTTKTVIPSPNLSNSTTISGSSQAIDVNSEPQFPFEIYFQSNSIHFDRFDGNTLSSVSASITSSTADSDSFSPRSGFKVSEFVDSIIFQKTGSNLQIWQNGILKATATDRTETTQNKANLYIGSKGGTTNFLTASLSFISIYDTALREAQIEGLYLSTDGKPYVGNVFYNQGIITITNPSYTEMIFHPRSFSGEKIQYQGTHLIYENEYQCMAEQHEFDITLNPSARKIKSSNSEDLANFATGSKFKPYVTTIGLYNDNGELLVVGKLGQAIRMTDEADTTFVVRFDT